MSDTRNPMSPAEFDAAVRALQRRLPELSCTSGRRSKLRNDRVSGNPASKHLLDMARDLVGTTDDLKQGLSQCSILGLWGLIHGGGANIHLHVQGLPPGDVAEWWSKKYSEDE